MFFFFQSSTLFFLPFFKYHVVFQIPCCVSNTMVYFKYHVMFQIPCYVSNAMLCFKYHVVFQIPCNKGLYKSYSSLKISALTRILKLPGFLKFLLKNQCKIPTPTPALSSAFAGPCKVLLTDNLVPFLIRANWKSRSFTWEKQSKIQIWIPALALVFDFAF